MTAAQDLAEQLATKPGYSLRTTKQQVNAVSEEMANSHRGHAEADIFAFAVHDPESRAASARYLKSKNKG